jgi:predicted dinucleotide-binding enzyme
MKIGIIGSGNIGANAARLFVGAGYKSDKEGKQYVLRN